MGRRSSGGGARSGSRRAPVRSPPQHVNRAPPPAFAQGGGGSMLSGIGSTIAQGLAFGTGSEIAHRAVDAVVGPRSIQVESRDSDAAAPYPSPTMNTLGGSDACGNQNKIFQDCLNENGSDISKCQFYLDMLSECRRNSGSVFAM